MTDACRSLCNGKLASSTADAADAEFWDHIVDSHVIRYRRGRPGDFSPKCGRKLAFWVERIEPVPRG
jgi:hypothetical protein